MKKFELSFSIATYLLSTLAGVSAIIAMCMIFRRRYDAQYFKIDYLPTVYSVPNSFDTPIRTLDPKVPLWVGAITDLLEMFMRNQGLHEGIFKGYNYTLLDPQLLYNRYLELCSDSTSRECNFKNSAAFAASFFHSFNGSRNAFGDGTYFETKLPQFAINVRDIKKMLFQKKHPLLLSMPDISARYYFPCSASSDPTACSQQKIPCPDSVETESFCDFYTSPTLLPNGNFFVPQHPAIATVRGTFNAAIVGYSDDFVPSSFVHQFSSQNLPKGGFFLRGLDGPSGGNRLAILDGSEERSGFKAKCISRKDPQFWSGCVRKLKQKSKNSAETHISEKAMISEKMKISETPETVLDCSGATPLMCRDPSLGYCTDEEAYAIVSAPSIVKDHVVTEAEDGLTSTRMVKLGLSEAPFSIQAKGEAFDFSYVPYWDLGDVFKDESPDISAALGINKELCGYWFLPYELFEMAGSMAGPEVGSAMAMDLPAKWSMGSYEALKKNVKTFKADGNRFLD